MKIVDYRDGFFFVGRGGSGLGLDQEQEQAELPSFFFLVFFQVLI